MRIEMSEAMVEIIIKALKHSVRMNQQTLPDPNYRDPYMDFKDPYDRKKFQREIEEKFKVGSEKIERKLSVIDYLNSQLVKKEVAK